MKFLEERHLNNPACKFTLANLDEVLVPYLKAQGDEVQEEQALSSFIRKASAHAKRFGPPLLVDFYVKHLLWTICHHAADCDVDFPGRWWSAWRSARSKTFQFVAKEMAPAIQNDELVSLEDEIASVTERYFTEDERRIVELLTAWQGGEGPVRSLLFREWQTLSQRQMERNEQERRERIGSTEDQKARVLAYLDHAVTPHLPALLGRYRKLVKTGAYGEKIFKSWKKEVRYFGDEVLGMFQQREVTDNDLERDEIEEIAYEHITELVEAQNIQDR